MFHWLTYLFFHYFMTPWLRRAFDMDGHVDS